MKQEQTLVAHCSVYINSLEYYETLITVGVRSGCPGRVDQNGLKPWGAEPVMDQRRRDLNEALTTVCCQLGCRKSDLTIMC